MLPFLQNVTRGRGIPDERLEEVGEHYYAFGGRSPINDQNRALLAALRASFDEIGLDLPIYWGNRNWAPYLTDTMRQMADDGVRRAVVIVTSAYPSYSGCRQYRENLEDAAQKPRGRSPVRQAAGTTRTTLASSGRSSSPPPRRSAGCPRAPRSPT